MKKDFLAIDIGNTHIVFGIFRGDKILSNLRISTQNERTADEIGILINQFCNLNRISLSDLTECGISSVVPGMTNTIHSGINKYLSIEALNIDHTLDLGIKILYKDPSQVGADRICNSAAAFNKYGGPIIIIDFGTATTFDVVSKRGEYLGGIIVPGIETSAYDLQRRAAKLPKIELKFPDEIIGKDTVSSMQSGILYSAVDSTEGIIKRICKSLGLGPMVIATGGFSALISEKLKKIDRIEPNLVLEGIKLIYRRNKNHK
jgi:type III pantothenate kinase